MGEVAEAHRKRDGADGMARIAGTSQHVAGLQQALLAHEGREGRAFALEQHVDVARAQPMVGSDILHGEAGCREIFADVGLDGVEPCSAHAARECERCAIARRAERQRHQVVYMRDRKRDEEVSTGSLRASVISAEVSVPVLSVHNTDMAPSACLGSFATVRSG